MPDYEKMYYDLFNVVTKSIELLQQGQLSAEDTYISSAEDEEAPDYDDEGEDIQRGKA